MCENERFENWATGSVRFKILKNSLPLKRSQYQSIFEGIKSVSNMNKLKK